jgi:hypothetical protein
LVSVVMHKRLDLMAHPCFDSPNGTTLPPLRLSLTLSGDVSLAAYEGGALAALIVASRALGERTLVIDSIACASVASITGLLAARSLLGGVDPIALFASAGLHDVSLETARADSPDSAISPAPFSPRALISMATCALGPHGLPNGGALIRQREPVRLSMALTDLALLGNDHAGCHPERAASTSTPHDWYDVELTNAATPHDYVMLANAAPSVESKVPGLPDDGPLIRTMDLAREISGDDERLYLVIHPNPASPLLSPFDVAWMENMAPGCPDSSDTRPAATRIMAERQADQSDDYAALLRSLVEPTDDTQQRGETNVEVIPRSAGWLASAPASDFAVGYRAMTDWLGYHLNRHLPRVDLSPALERVNEQYGRIEEKDVHCEGVRPRGEEVGRGHRISSSTRNYLRGVDASRERSCLPPGLTRK